MRTGVSLVGTALLFGTWLGCGDNSPTCGDGTVLDHGMCISSGPQCGDNTTLQDGVCVADPPTTCGPGTTKQNGSCVVDHSAPDPVTGLTATVNGSNIDLSWTAGANSTRSLLVRLVAGASDAPAGSTTYTAGQTLPNGAVVVAAGAVTAASDAFTTPGRYTYMVWSQNDSGNYGYGREVGALAAVPTQSGTIALDASGATAATVSAQPANIGLAVANFAYDSGTSTATFDLTATNNTAGPYYNLKAVIKSISVGTVTQSGTTAAGDPFVSLQIAGILPGQSATTTVTVTGVGPTDTPSIDVEMQESSFGIFGTDAIDAGGSTSMKLQLPSVLGPPEEPYSFFMGGVFSTSGRYFYGIARWASGFYRLDTSNGDVLAISALPISPAHGVCVTQGSDGYVYAVYGLGGHRSGQSGATNYAVALTKLDPGTMTTVASTTLTFPGLTAVKMCAFAGTRVAITAGASVYFADTSTMAFVDANTSTSDTIDPVDTGASNNLRSLAFSLDGATLYATPTKNDQNIYAVDTASFAVSTYHTTGGRSYALKVDSAGTLWWGQDDGLYSFDGSTETKVPVLTAPVRSIASVSGGHAIVGNRNDSFTVDTTTGDVTNSGSLTSGWGAHTFTMFTTP